MARQMKDSGVEWVGEIPEEWSINRVKYVCTEVLDQLPATTAPDYEFDYVDISSVTYDNGIINKEAMSFSSAPSRARRIVRLGDIIFSTVRTYLKAIALIGEQDENVIVSTGFAVYRSISTDRRFLFYAMQNHSFVSTIEAHSTGVSYPAIASSKISSFHIVLPSSTEQHRIADYLDAKCAEIDKVVEKTRETIEEYKKLKQSIITETVTKGLNPDAEMKDSGIEWVGTIPEHWNVRPIYVYFGERKNPNDRGEENNLLSLSYGRIIRKDINTNEGLLPASFNTYNIVEAGDIIIRPTDLQNDKRSLRTGLAKERGIITSAYIALHPLIPQDTRFFHYLLHSYDVTKVFYNLGSGVRQGLNFSEFSKLMVFEPQHEEQIAIANYLDAKCAELDSIIEKKEQLIEELGSYKKSLIYEYVTGKKEVQA